MIENARAIYQTGKWKKWVIPVCLLCTLITCIQLLNSGNYNNFRIFSFSSLHLLAHQPLYTLYPQNYSDYFLYHPSFAVLFMPLALLPTPLALCVWIFLSALVYIRTIHLLPGITDTGKKIILLFVLPEFINNLQYAQTNILLTALMLLVFISFEKNRLLPAALFTVLAFCIKGYGAIAGLLFLLYPGKIKFMGYCILCGLILSALPLLFVSFAETIQYYKDWLAMIGSDEIKESMSVTGILGKIHINEWLITIVALLLLIVSFAFTLRRPFLKAPLQSRTFLCCYLLVWVVLFNRTAESPTYQLAVTGVAGWLVISKYNARQLYLGGLFLLVLYILPSDLFPAFFHRYFLEYQLKVYPFFLAFLGMQYQLIFGHPKMAQV